MNLLVFEKLSRGQKTASALLSAGLLLATPGIGADVVDPVFPNVQALASTPLNARVLKTSEKDGIVIEEIMYHSEMDGEKSVDIFAFFGYPKGAQGLPAFVWNQASMAQASTHFVEAGARRGYAVLCIDYPFQGYRSSGGYTLRGLEVGDDPARAPLAHAAIALLKGVTYLESRPEVDKDRIGMAGSSWGGFMTTLMVGLDARLKVGSCFFGTGNLQLGCSWFEGACTDPVIAERWRTTIDPAWRLAKTKTPISWCTGTLDNYYWMPALMKTYEMAGGKKHLGLIANWDHGLPPIMDDEVLGWLDVHLQGHPAFPELTPITVSRQGGEVLATWTFFAPPERQPASADLMLSYGEAGNWRCRNWITLPAQIEGSTCTARLPTSSLPIFISGSVVAENGYRHSTPMLRVDPGQHGLLGPQPNVDSFAEWGGFETEMPAYMYAFPKIATSPDARSGKRALILKPKRQLMPPVLFIAGLHYRLEGYFKAATPAQVTVQLKGRFDAERRAKDLVVDVGRDWTPFHLDYPTDAAMMTDLSLTLLTPEDNTVLLDDLSFRPLTDKH